MPYHEHEADCMQLCIFVLRLKRKPDGLDHLKLMAKHKPAMLWL